VQRARLAVLGALILLASLAGVPGPSATARAEASDTAAERAKGPNIVVVMADDMRVDDIAFAPRVRRMVAEHGLVFDNSFSPFPLCCPARASFLTGQYAHNHRVYWHERPYGYGAFDDSRTLATALQAAGYQTGYIGKYLNRYGLDRSKVSGRPSHRYVPQGWTDWRAGFENPGGIGVHGGMYNYMNTPFNVNGKIDNRYGGEYNTHVIGDFSVDMARTFARGRKPFFMYVNYLAPHFGGPWEPDDPGVVRDARGQRARLLTPARPPSIRGRFDRAVVRAPGMPKRGRAAEARIGDKPRFYRRLPEPNRAVRRAMRESSRQRVESVYVMDQQIARLVRALKRSGEWANTVFMFTSDNGFYAGEHRQVSGKLRPHEPSFRVPFVMTGPGMRSGRHVYDPISTIDVSASILDLANARPPRPPDGISRVPTMRTRDRGWNSPIIYEATHTARKRKAKGFRDTRSSIGIRTGRYAYFRHRSGGNELYDLVKDPLQNRNVYGIKAYRSVQTELAQVWQEVRNCRTAGCRSLLPESLRVSAVDQRAYTRHYWKRIIKTYGFRHVPD